MSDYQTRAREAATEADKLDAAALQETSRAMARAAADAARALRDLSEAFHKLHVQVQAMAAKKAAKK